MIKETRRCFPKKQHVVSINKNETKVNINSVGLPYIKRITENISKILKDYNVLVYTYPLKTIGQILPSAKDPIDNFQKVGAIYSIPCFHCNYVYIGETGRCFETRLKEHKRDNNSKNLAKLDDQNLHKKTALVKHSFTNEHKIDFKNSKVLQFQTDFIKRRFLESWFINLTDNSMNDKDIQSFLQIYNTIKN